MIDYRCNYGDFGGIKLINKNGETVIFRNNSVDGYYEVIICETLEELKKYRDGFFIACQIGCLKGGVWKLARCFSAESYESDGFELIGDNITIYREFNAFFIVLNENCDNEII